MATTIKIALYNNLAACYLNLKDFPNAKSACDEALALDPTQTKALYMNNLQFETYPVNRYRRAKALTADINAEIEHYKAAQDDLKRALEITPDDSIIQQLLNKIKSDMVRAKSSSQSFKGIFIDKKDKNDKKNASDKDTAPSSTDSRSQSDKKTEIAAKPNEPVKIDKGLSNKNETKSSESNSIPAKRDTQKKVENPVKAAPKEEEKRPSDKKSSGKTKQEQVQEDFEKNNEVWKMLHGDKDANSEDHDYSLSFAGKENAEIPREIKELEK